MPSPTGSVTCWPTDASRARQAYHVLTGVLDDTVKDGRLASNTVAGVDLPRLASKRRRYRRHECQAGAEINV